MDPNTYLKPYKFLDRLNKYLVNAYYVHFLNENGNLKDALLKARMDHSFGTLEEIAEDIPWKEGVTDEEKRQQLKKQKEKLRKDQEENVEDFFLILYNNSLVMFCAVIDNFLLDSIKVITAQNSDTLKELSSEGDISVAEVLDENTYKDVFGILQKKFLERFDYASFEDKISYLEDIGIDSRILFRLASEEYKTKYDNPRSIIENMYSKRHRIVHDSEIEIQSYQELSDFGNLLSHLIVKWGAGDISSNFNIPSDFSLLYNDQANYQELDLE